MQRTINIIKKYSCFVQCRRDKYSEELDVITYSETAVFVPPITQGKVIKVYDGDTLTIASKLHNSYDPTIYRFSIRLAGIDTPELRGSNPQERAMAIEARNILSNLVMDKNVFVRNARTEKYGRILADVYLDEINLSEYLLDQKVAHEYNGGKKTSFS